MPLPLKRTFRAAEPVSYQWYNEVARRLADAQGIADILALLPGYNAGVLQSLTHAADGALEWTDADEMISDALAQLPNYNPAGKQVVYQDNTNVQWIDVEEC